MTPAFQWILEMVDKASKPTRDAEKATGGYEKELRKVEQQIERIKAHPLEFKKLGAAKKELRELSGGSRSFAQRFEEVGTAVKRMGFVQNLMLGVEALKLGYEVGEKVVDVVYDIGKEMVNAAGGAERFKISFNALLGSEGAEDVLSYIEQIEKHTELSGAELKGLAADFLAVGFSAKELGQVLPAALDIGAFRGGGLANIQAAAAALDHIKTTGEISKRSLGALGLEWTKVMAELRKETGLTDEELKKKMEGGKFGKQTLHAVLQVTADKQGGALGNTAETMADAVLSKFKKIRDLPEKIFEKWADTPGFTKFSAALSKILEKLDPAGPNGKKIFAALDGASAKVVSLIAKFAEGDGIDKFASAVSTVLGDIDKIPGVVDKVITASEVLATIWAGSTIVGAVTTLTAAFPALGTAAGVAMGVFGAAAAPIAAVAAAAASVGYAVYKIVSAVKELGGLAYVWRDFKDWAGGAKPAAASGNTPKNMDWDESTNSWRPRGGGMPSQSARVAQGGDVRQSLHVETHVHVNGDANPDEIADAINQSLPGSLQQSMERMAVSSGAL